MADNDRFTDEKGIGPEEISLYDALVKHWASTSDDEYTTHEQIDELFSEKVKPFGTATDEELAAIINGYYNGTISLEDIQKVWHIGDTRSIPLTSIYTNNGTYPYTWTVGQYESHAAQILNVRIIDFVHDDLTDNINNKSKALITVEPTEVLQSNGSSENGFLIFFNAPQGRPYNTKNWERCDRRGWCNQSFYNALPDYIKNLIKPVNKLTYSVLDNDVVTTEDKIFLLSMTEYFVNASAGIAYSGEGETYSYYKAATGIDYYPCLSEGGLWTRSPSSSNGGNLYYCYIFKGNNQNISETWGTDSYGLAPAFCL